MRRPSGRRGFTLIEVLIASAVLAGMGAIVFGSASQAIKLRNDVSAADERYAQIRLAMDRMVSEMSVAFLSEHYDRKRYRERPTVFKGDDRGHEDELLFTSMSNERFEADAKTSDQAVIKYFVDSDPDLEGTRALFRRVNPIIDEEADKRGTRAVLCEDVKHFDLEYWDAVKNEWVREWDASRPEQMGVMPERVKISLTIVNELKQEQVFTTQARIMMQRSLDF